MKHLVYLILIALLLGLSFYLWRWPSHTIRDTASSEEVDKLHARLDSANAAAKLMEDSVNALTESNISLEVQKGQAEIEINRKEADLKRYIGKYESLVELWPGPSGYQPTDLCDSVKRACDSIVLASKGTGENNSYIAWNKYYRTVVDSIESNNKKIIAKYESQKTFDAQFRNDLTSNLIRVDDENVKLKKNAKNAYIIGGAAGIVVTTVIYSLLNRH